MTRWAATGRVPPASGVTVRAVEFPAGLRTCRIEFGTVTSISAMPTIGLVPVARPTTVCDRSIAPAPESSASTSCPASVTLTSNSTW